MTTTYDTQGGGLHSEIEGYVRDPAFGAVLFGQWVPRVFEAKTADELRRLTLAARRGDVCYFTADETNGIDWTLRYTADGSTYPWRVVGPPIHASIATAESTTSTSFTDLATVGPSVTVPLAGVYNHRYGARITNGAAALTDAIVNITSPSATGYGVNAYSTNQNTFNGGSVSTEFHATLTVLGVYKLQYAVGPANSMQFQNRWLSLTPVRVG